LTWKPKVKTMATGRKATQKGRRESIATVREQTSWPVRDAMFRTRQRKVLRQAEMTCPSVYSQTESNNMIDAQIQFYGQYIQLNEQVTLQNQDPKINKVYFA